MIVSNLSARALVPGDVVIAVEEVPTRWGTTPVFSIERRDTPELLAAIARIHEAASR